MEKLSKEFVENCIKKNDPFPCLDRFLYVMQNILVLRGIEEAGYQLKSVITLRFSARTNYYVEPPIDYVAIVCDLDESFSPEIPTDNLYRDDFLELEQDDINAQQAAHNEMSIRDFEDFLCSYNEDVHRKFLDILKKKLGE